MVGPLRSARSALDIKLVEFQPVHESSATAEIL